MYLFSATSCGMWNFPDQGSNLCPLRWKGRVLTTGPQEVQGQCSEKTGPVAGVKAQVPSEGLGMQSGRGSEGVGWASGGPAVGQGVRGGSGVGEAHSPLQSRALSISQM